MESVLLPPSNMKVLIVEDDAAIQNFLKRGFAYKQFTIDQAVDGLDGLRKLMNNEYSIAIIDLMLPQLDGTALIEKAREKGNKTPLIILSALQDLATKKRLLDIGADDFITKPFSFEELYARMLAVLRRCQHRFPTEHLKFSDLELAPEKRTAFRSGKKLVLRKKEYALLEYLMQHPNQVISREELMQNVWDYQSFVMSNTVDSHVSSLRQKVDHNQKIQLIKTIYGIGYMLNNE